MKKFVSLLVITFILLSFSSIQPSKAEDKSSWTWAKAYGGKYADKSGQMFITPDGGYVIYGQTYDPKNRWELFVMKINKRGNLEWSKVYSKGKSETAIDDTDIYVTKDNGFIVASMSKSFGKDHDLVVLKLDSKGDIEWQKVFVEEGGVDIWDVIQTSDGGYIIGGNGSISEKKDRYAFGIKLNGEGNFEWGKAFKLAFGRWDYNTDLSINKKEQICVIDDIYKDYDVGFFVFEDKEGAFLLSGRNYHWRGKWISNPSIIKMDLYGNVEWAKIINCGNDIDGGDTVIEAHDEGYVVGGWTYSLGAGEEDFLMYKVDRSGDLEWIKAYGGSKKDGAVFISRTDSGYAMTGYTNSFRDDGWDIIYFEALKNGNIKWVKRFGGNRDNKFEYRFGTILQTEDKGFVLNTFMNSFGNRGIDAIVLKTNSDGEIPDCPYIKDVDVKVKDYTNKVEAVSVKPMVLDFNWKAKDADFTVKDIDFGEFTICEPPPAIPYPISPTKGETLKTLTPTLSWSESINADYHKVQISDKRDFSNIVFEKETENTTVTIPNGILKDGCTYYWRVKGINVLHQGEWSEIYSFKINVVNPPLKPESLEATQVEEGIKLSWSPSLSGTYPISGYEIFKGESMDNLTQLTKIFGSQTSYLDKDVTYGKTYYYKVRAFDTEGNHSEFSNVVSITVEDITPPSIAISSPENNSYTNKDTTTIKGSVSDSLSGVDKLTVNGEEINIKDNGEFQKEITLSEGENKINIEAYDKAGNKTEKTLIIYLDKTPPELYVNIPNKVYNKSFITITGNVKDDLSGVLSVKINGEEVKALNEYGRFEYPSLPLSLGSNTIVIEVLDKVGNKLEKEFTIENIQSIILKLQIGNRIMLVNDKVVEIDVPPTIVEGRTLLPIRWVAEPLGADVGWDGEERKVTVSLNNTTIELWIGKPTARVNGIEKPIDPNNPKVVPMILNGRTMLPVRFVAENLGCKVEWDGITRTVTIIYPGD